MKATDIEKIQSKILVIRRQRVMLDTDLAKLYGVETKVLNQAVKRHAERFPEDFMFQLTQIEFKSLRSQIVTLKRGAHRKYLPYAFSQKGIAMLSSVLNSPKAIEINIRIMRIFVQTGELLRNQFEILKKIEKIERQGTKNSKDIEMIFQAIRELYGYQEKEESKKIGF